MSPFEIGNTPQSIVRTRYFRGIFVLAVVAFAALFIGFYDLVFKAIDNAVTVQSRFFVEGVSKNVEENYHRIHRETSTLLVNRAIGRYLSVDHNDVDRTRTARKGVDEYITWWLEEVDNAAYAALTYLNSAGEMLVVYQAQHKRQAYLDAATPRQQFNQPTVNVTQESDTSPEDTNLRDMVTRTWTQEPSPTKADEYSLVLPDSTRLFRSIQPILARKTGEIIGFLAIDLHFERIFGSDVEADRRLLLSQQGSGVIIHDAISPEHPQKHVADVYPSFAKALTENEQEGPINVEFEHDHANYSAYTVDLENPSWRVTSLVENSDYVDHANERGTLLIVTALLFVALAGTSIVVLTRRVEERTRKLADARDRLEEELNSAHELQMGLMPKQAPATTMLDIAGRCQPAAQVGGDFFQYFELEKNRIAIAMADVTGHGMRAAVPTMVFSGLLSNQIIYSRTIEDLFLQLNRSLLNTLEKRTFICFALGEIDLERKIVRLGNSGCPYSYHYSAKTNAIEEVVISAFPLGLRRDPEYPVRELKVARGDRIVFCSDGIIETNNADGEVFGFERTAELIKVGCERDLASQNLIDLVFDEVGNFSGEAEQGDDQTMVVVSWVE